MRWISSRNPWIKFILWVLIILILIFGVVTVFKNVIIGFFPPLIQSRMALLDADKVVNNFRSMDHLFPYRTLAAPEKSFHFKRELQPLIDTYDYEGKTYPVEDFLKRTTTTGFMVIQDDTILSENYFLGNTEESLATSWSVAKSFTSAAVGIAVKDGLIHSINDPVTDYMPELKGSGYDGVPVKDILQMSSGVSFDENYDFPLSDIQLMMYWTYLLNKPVGDYIPRLWSERKSGTALDYISVDAEVLGLLVERVTHRPLADFVAEKLWKPLGMESDAIWLTDEYGNAMGYCCLNAILRDYAKLGRLYLNKGNWQGTQILPEKWVYDSTHADKPYLEPGANFFYPLGYGYQWWIPVNGEDFTAEGVWGQFIYVSPQDNLIIVKTSADANFNDHEVETIALFHSIAESLRRK